VNLATYKTLSGLNVSTSDTALVTAQILRTKSMLETLLGFTLGPSSKVNENIYNELGKSNAECFCPSVNTEDLLPPDAVVNAYRLFRYDERDKFFHIDPASTIHAIKLVYIKPGTGNNGITMKTFENDEIRMQYNNMDWVKYLEHCNDCLCTCECNECVQLAVDADWLWENSTDIPDELLYIWVDLITYYSDLKRDIKSESIDTHSYSRDALTNPMDEKYVISVLKKYAGPYGSAVQMPV
jgi:hypothetical protein